MLIHVYEVKQIKERFSDEESWIVDPDGTGRWGRDIEVYLIQPNLNLRSRYATAELAWEDIENKGDLNAPYVVMPVSYSTKYPDEYNIKGA